MLGATHVALLASAIGAVQAGNGFWRQGCDVLVKERMDPIVARAKLPSAHAHMIGGGSSISPIVTSAQLRKSKCTSATTKGDFSAYWSPLLYFQYANGSVAEVSGGMTTYFHAGDRIFPDDLHIVAGNPFATSYNKSDPTAAAFECLDYSGSGNSKGTDWPMRDGLRTQFNLPRCWDGKHLDATDHGSHMAYPTDRVDGRKCPASHPILLMQIFFELLFGINEFADQWHLAKNPKWPFIWASGNTSPYDFIMGWDRATLQAANDKCTDNASGEIDVNCAGILERNPQSGQCKTTPMVDEVVTGVLPRLPGCNPTFGASGGYKPPTCPNLKDPQVLTPNVGFLGSSPPAGSCVLSGGASVLAKTTNGYGYAGCFAYEGARPFFSTSHGAGMTIEQCSVAAAAAKAKTFGLEYGGECRSTTATVPIKSSDSGKCSMPCTANKKQLCGGPSANSVYVKDLSPDVPGTCKKQSAASYNAKAPSEDAWLKTASILTVAAKPTKSASSSKKTSAKTTSVKAAASTPRVAQQLAVVAKATDASSCALTSTPRLQRRHRSTH